MFELKNMIVYKISNTNPLTEKYNNIYSILDLCSILIKYAINKPKKGIAKISP
jgi:hypothetical protein